MGTVTAYFFGICTHILNAGTAVGGGTIRRSILVDASKGYTVNRDPPIKIHPHVPLLFIPRTCSLADQPIPGIIPVLDGLWRLDGVKLYIGNYVAGLLDSPVPMAVPSLELQAGGFRAPLSTLAKYGDGAAAFFDTVGASFSAYDPEGPKGSSVSITVTTSDDVPELVIHPFPRHNAPRVVVPLPQDAVLIFANAGRCFGKYETDEDFLLHYLVTTEIPEIVDVSTLVPRTADQAPSPANAIPAAHSKVIDPFLNFFSMFLSGAPGGGVGCSNSTYP